MGVNKHEDENTRESTGKGVALSGEKCRNLFQAPPKTFLKLAYPVDGSDGQRRPRGQSGYCTQNVWGSQPARGGDKVWVPIGQYIHVTSCIGVAPRITGQRDV